jgi:predicted GNAT superfamily acetyltransferase
MSLRNVSMADRPAILRLNEESVEHLSPLTQSRLAGLLTQPGFHRVWEAGGEIAAFLLAVDQNAEYDSPNYLWFRERYPSFLYIDRIVVGREYRRRGIAEKIYRDVFAFAARRRYEYMACEIDIQPPNGGSLKFHEKFGFLEVGRQRPYDGKKLVSLRICKVSK